MTHYEIFTYDKDVTKIEDHAVYSNLDLLFAAGYHDDAEVFERHLLAPGLERITKTTVGSLRTW